MTTRNSDYLAIFIAALIWILFLTTAAGGEVLSFLVSFYSQFG